MRIAFIGLGQMGRPMAERLLERGHTLIAHNRSRAAVDALVAKGAVPAHSPAEAADSADVVMTNLLLPEQLREVYLGPAGALSQPRSGALFIDFATVEPTFAREMGAAVASAGGRFLDCPVSGGPWGAAAGTLSIMAGGAPEDFAAARPLLDVLGKKVFHVGPVGAGSTAKVCNQILTGVAHALVSEAMVLGTKAGVDPRTLFEVFKASSGQSNSLERAVPNFILPGKFDAAYPIEGIIKDLECAIRTAKTFGVRLMFAPIAQQLYVEAAGLGHGKQDVAAVIRPMERIAGIEVRERKA